MASGKGNGLVIISITPGVILPGDANKTTKWYTYLLLVHVLIWISTHRVMKIAAGSLLVEVCS